MGNQTFDREKKKRIDKKGEAGDKKKLYLDQENIDDKIEKSVQGKIHEKPEPAKKRIKVHEKDLEEEK